MMTVEDLERQCEEKRQKWLFWRKHERSWLPWLRDRAWEAKDKYRNYQEMLYHRRRAEKGEYDDTWE